MTKSVFSKVKCLFLLPATLALASLAASESTPAKEENSQNSVATTETPSLDIAKISEAFGHLIGKNIESLGFKFDITQIVQGLQDAAAGKECPMSEMECVQAISAVQESVFKEKAAENLKKADEFMTKNSQEKDIVVVEKGKLHYKIEKIGNGEEIQPHFSPLIRYNGKFIDGTTFGSSKEDEMISLDETIPGISKGLVGMKEGEKRVIYIHPDLGYGTNGHLPPNSLLAFEVEIVKAQAPQMQDDALTSNSPGGGKPSHEIATPTQQPAETLR